MPDPMTVSDITNWSGRKFSEIFKEEKFFSCLVKGFAKSVTGLVASESLF